MRGFLICRVGLEGLGLSNAAVGRCKALILQTPGEAAAALLRLRARADAGGKGAFSPPPACLDEIQVTVDSEVLACRKSRYFCLEVFARVCWSGSPQICRVLFVMHFVTFTGCVRSLCLRRSGRTRPPNGR